MDAVTAERALFGGCALWALTMAMFAAIPREED